LRPVDTLARTYPISIIIPAHNAMPGVSQCLQALAKNNLAETQIILVDDGSSDETSSALDVLSAVDIPTQSIRLDPQSGPGAARNRGLESAHHPYLLFLDADVLLPEQSLDWLRDSLDLYSHRTEVGGVLGTYAENLPAAGFWTNFKNLTTCFLYRTTETLSPFIHTPIFCTRKELIEKAGGFDAGLATAEDFQLGLNLGTMGYRFVIDRRIQGLHLKQYSLKGILLEDRRRIRDLRRAKPKEEQRRFYYRAHRWGRIASVALPLPILVLGGLGLWVPASALASFLLLGLFYGFNLRFLRYCRKRLGWSFFFKATLFLFMEMLWASFCLASSLVQKD
jgi:glycosyltransferase involved in cell wall biosynthesis